MSRANVARIDMFLVPAISAIRRVTSRSAIKQRLDALFRDKQYDQGNEPSHHIAYLYDYAGHASDTQRQVSKIRDLYKNSADGLPGNDDAGQMSAWYICSALGFYPVTPGVPTYAIGTPKYAKATLHLANGRSFVINAVDASASTPYIRSATLNGRPIDTYLIEHAAIMKGGELIFHMAASPNPSWPQPPMKQSNVRQDESLMNHRSPVTD
jgi:putative alpha-1,2-mannosidase